MSMDLSNPGAMSVETFEARMAMAATTGALWHLVMEYVRGTDIERVVYHHLPPMGAPDGDAIDVAAYGVPHDLVRRYVDERLYRENPMLQHALRSIEPFYFDEVPLTDDISATQRLFVDVIRLLGFDRGLGIQVFGPHGRNGYCGLGFRAGVTRLEPEEVRSLQWTAQLAHLRYCSLLAPEQGPPPQLSKREREVLTWVARGKSNASIGEILGISTHTVDAHLRRIYLKLGVFDRVSAALRGIGVGLICSAT